MSIGGSMRIVVVGAGYVGLSTALVLSMQHNITVVDIDSLRVSEINNGILPFHEPGMDNILERALDSNSLIAHTELSTDSPQDAVIICVDTPSQEDGSVDLSSVRAIAHSILNQFEELAKDYLLVALRSTTPPGTTRKLLLDPLISQNLPVGVVYNPEFLRQGHAIHDFLNPDRMVIGQSDEKAGDIYLELFASCVQLHNVPIYHMTLESSELCKYVSNCFLATKVSFVNEIASLAERIPNVDIDAVMSGVTADSRIYPSHLKPGLGFGGSCLPKDLSGLISYGKSHCLKMPILNAVREVNQATTDRIMKILSSSDVDIKREKVAILGLAYKAGTSDSRGSSTLTLIKQLISSGALVWVHDPIADPRYLEKDVTFTRDLKACVKDARVVFLMTDWELYRDTGVETILDGTNGKFLIDARRIFTHSDIPKGVTYRAIGSYVHEEE